MKKNNYEKPTLEIIIFQEESILTASTQDYDVSDWFEK